MGILCVLSLISALILSAQTAGRLSGVVEDPSGAPVPQAVISLALHGSTETVFDSSASGDGHFAVAGLPPGMYDVTVRASGFQIRVLRGVKIDPGRELALPPVRLEVGAVAETVDVIANAPTIQTGTAEISSTVTSAQVQDLPVLDRQMITLIKTQAGVSDSRGPTTVNGLRTSAINVTLDGINIQDNYFRRNSLDFMPNRPVTDQIAEFTLTTSNQNATVGGGAAQVIMVTPSGSNELHGRLLWNNRNSAFSANDWFNNQQGVRNPFLNRNQFGGYAGGRIIKDRLFFYGGFERLDNREQESVNRRILTADARQGIFTYRDASGQTQKVDILGAAGASIDSRIASLLQQTPGPERINNFNLGDSLPGFLRNTAGYSFLMRDNIVRNNYTGKGDYFISTRHALSATVLVNRERVDRADAQNDSAADFNGYDAIPVIYTEATRKLVSLAHRWSPGPRFTNEARYGFNLAPTSFLSSAELAPYQVTGSLFSNPVSNALPNGRDTYTFHYMDNAAYSAGRHSLQFGFNLQQLKIRTWNYGGILPFYTLGAGAGHRGLTGAELPGASSQDINAANQHLATLAGLLDRATQAFVVNDRQAGFVGGEPEERNLRFRTMALYFQDNWRVNRRLVVTLGLRWEPMWPVDEKNALYLMPVVQNNDVLGTLMSNATLDFAGGSAGRPWYKRDSNNFAPNIGLALDPFGNGKTSFRAGYMVAYFNDNAVAALQNSLGSNTGLRATPLLTRLSNTLANPPSIAAPPLRVPTTFADNFALDRTSAAGIPDPNLVSPYIQQWSAGLQHDFGGATLEIRYVGNKGTKLYRGLDFNQIDIRSNGFLDDFIRARSNGNLARAATGAFNPHYDPAIPGSQPLLLLPNLPSAGGLNSAVYRNHLERGTVADYANTLQVEALNGPISFYRNPILQGANIMSNFGNSSYHSLQFDVTRRFRNGLQFQANYVYGKVLTDIGHEDDHQFDPLLDNNNAAIERARAPWDLTHAIKGNFVWQVPAFQQSSGWARRLFGGWTVAGFLTWQSGQPFSVFSRRGTLNRTGARSNQNTANTNLTKSELDQIFGLRMTGSGPVFVADRVRNPADGRAVAADGRQPFDGQAFFHPNPGGVGALQRRMFSGPWVFNMDASLLKRIRLTERQTLEFRAEAFNATNSATFIVADQLLDSTAFGRVTSTFFDRRLMQFGLQYRF